MPKQGTHSLFEQNPFRLHKVGFREQRPYRGWLNLEYRGETRSEMAARRSMLLEQKREGQLPGHVRIPSPSAILEQKVRGDIYSIAVSPNFEEWHCSCPDWLYRKRATNQDCKHIRMVKSSIEGNLVEIRNLLERV